MGKPLQVLVAITCFAVLAAIGYIAYERYTLAASAWAAQAAADEKAAAQIEADLAFRRENEERRAQCFQMLEQYYSDPENSGMSPDDITRRCLATKLLTEREVMEVVSKFVN